MTEEFRFDWQAEGENTFLKWMIPLLLGDVLKDDRKHEEMVEATAKWTDITLTIQINGVEMPVREFLIGIEHNMNYYAEKEATRMLQEASSFPKLRDDLSALEAGVRVQMRGVAQALGLRVDWEED